ncbi:MAG: sensor hybrid histidine kinase [Frankiales bacterium]|nr:sensor hybrid histidine kinase [Frankiales bacterium]
MESLHEAILVLDRSGMIMICNLAAARMYGYAQSQLIGNRIDLLIPTPYRVEEAHISARVLDGEDINDYRTRRVRRDDRAMTVFVTMCTLFDSNGSISGTVVYNHCSIW